MSEEGREPTPEEIAAFEAQLSQLRVEDVVLQTVVSLVNLGARKAGLAGGAPEERDPEQVRMAVDGARGLLALVESRLGPDAAQLRDAISQLQLAYVRMGGTPAPAPEAGREGGAEAPKPAQSSGRLWVPGQ